MVERLVRKRIEPVKPPTTERLPPRVPLEPVKPPTTERLPPRVPFGQVIRYKRLGRIGAKRFRAIQARATREQRQALDARIREAKETYNKQVAASRGEGKARYEKAVAPAQKQEAQIRREGAERLRKAEAIVAELRLRLRDKPIKTTPELTQAIANMQSVKDATEKALQDVGLQRERIYRAYKQGEDKLVKEYATGLDKWIKEQEGALPELIEKAIERLRTVPIYAAPPQMGVAEGPEVEASIRRQLKAAGVEATSERIASVLAGKTIAGVRIAGIAEVVKPPYYVDPKLAMAALKKTKAEFEAAYVPHGGVWWEKESWIGLSEADKKIVREGGYKAFESAVAFRDKQFKKNNIDVGGGLWMRKEDWAEVKPEDKAYIREKGYGAWKAKFDRELATFKAEHIQVGPISYNQWVAKDDYWAMPFKQRDALKKGGWKGLESYIGANKATLKPYEVIVEGETHYDVVAALRAGIKDNKIHDAVTATFTKAEIDKATEGRIIEPKDTIERMQVWSEEISDPRTSAEIAKQMTELEHKELEGLKKTIEGADATGLEWIRGYVGKDWSKLDPRVAKALNDFVKAGRDVNEEYARYQEEILLPTLLDVRRNILGIWEPEGPLDRIGGLRYVEPGSLTYRAATGATGGLFDVMATIPYTIGSMLTTGAAKQSSAIMTEDKEKRKKLQQEAYAAPLSLAGGMAGFFAGIPYMVRKDPVSAMPYLAMVLVLGPKAIGKIGKALAQKVSPRYLSNQAVAIQADIPRAAIPKGMNPEVARKMVADLEYTWGKMAPKAAWEAARTGKDVVIRNKEGKAVGHATGFQQSVAQVLFHMFPDAYKTYIGNLKTKGYIEVEGGFYPGQFDSPHAAFSFLARRNPTSPGGLAKLYSLADLQELPPSILGLLEKGNLTAAKRALAHLAETGKLKPGIYPVWKWYGRPPKLELELWESPGLRYYPVKPQWYAKQKGVNTAVTMTTSPISYKGATARLTAGQDIPLLWVATKAAITEGRGMPSLAQLYKAELLAMAVEARKHMPWNIKLRQYTKFEEIPTVDSITASKFTGMQIVKVKTKAAHMKDWEIARPHEKTPWYAPKEKIVVDRHGRKLRKRVTVVAMDKDGRVMLVWDKVDKAWSLPGGRHDPKGKLGRNPWLNYVDEKGAAYGQVLSETNIPLSHLQKVGIYRGKPTLHSLWGSPVYVGKAAKTVFDLKKYHPKAPEVIRAMWWDGKTPITTYPHVADILKSVEGMDVGKINIYKGTHHILRGARDRAFADRVQLRRKMVKVEPLRQELVKEELGKINDIVRKVEKKARDRVGTTTGPTLETIAAEFKETIATIPKTELGQYARVTVVSLGTARGITGEAIKVIADITKITHPGAEVSIRSGSQGWIGELAQAFTQSGKYSRVQRMRLFRTEPPGGEFWTVVAKRKGELRTRKLTYEEAFKDEMQKMSQRLIEERYELPYRRSKAGRPLYQLPIYAYAETYDKLRAQEPEYGIQARREWEPRISEIEPGVRRVLPEPKPYEKRPLEPRLAEIEPGVRRRLPTRKPLAYPKYPAKKPPVPYPKVTAYYPPKAGLPVVPPPPREVTYPPVVTERPPKPVVPPPPPPVLWGRKGAWEELSTAEKQAAIVWKQGWYFWALPAPYTQKHLIGSMKPFPGTKVHKGFKSAYKSVARVKGAVLPEEIYLDLGIMDITFKSDKRGKDVVMKYAPDIRQATTAPAPKQFPRRMPIRRRREVSPPRVGFVA